LDLILGQSLFQA